MNSIDIKIANAKRRAAEEKAQAGQAGNRPTPPMDANDRKMIVGDIARALEAKRAADQLVPRINAEAFAQVVRENARLWKQWEEWRARTPMPDPPPTAEQQAAFFGVKDAPKTFKIRRCLPYFLNGELVVSWPINNCQTTKG